MKRKLDVNKLVKISMLGAIATILMLIEIPLIPMFPLLKIDLGDIPAMIGAFAFGPLAGVMITFLKILLNFIFEGSATGGVGEFANFLIGIAMIVPASYIYHRNKTKKNAIVGLIIGAISLQVIAIFANVYILLPLYGIDPQGGVMNYIVAGLLPFNTIKAIIIAIVTFILYKKVSKAVFNEETFSKKSKELTEN